MDTTHDDNAATWRNLTDQLTPEQIEKLAVMEQRSRMSAEETARALLEGAREAATGNVIDSVIFGDVERPADARRFYTWEDQWETGLWMRSFEGTERNIGEAQVFIAGCQYQDGRTLRNIIIEARDDYDVPTARRIAAAIIEAAEEIERLQ